MDADITAIAAAAVPSVIAAVRAYGTEVLSKLKDAAVDATVRLGNGVLGRLLRRQESAPVLEAAVRDLAEDPDDEDRQSALRLQIRKILAADQQLAGEVADLMKTNGIAIVASGERAVAAQTISGSVVNTGDHTQITR